MGPKADQRMEFIWRRLVEPAELFGYPLGFDSLWWLAVAVPLLALALLFVFLTYRRESQTIGPRWSALLSGLRLLTYLTLFGLWLLPAMRQVTYSEQQSKVALLFDTSASITETSDRAGSEEPGENRLTRQEELLAFLQQAVPATPGGAVATTSAGSSSGASASSGTAPPDFLAQLLARNPLVCYRFGETLDPQPWLISNPGQRPSLDFWKRHLNPGQPPRWDDAPSSELLAELARLPSQAIAPGTTLPVRFPIADTMLFPPAPGESSGSGE